MNNTRLIATDLDGTLLDSAMRLSGENKKALERCISNNIEVVIATGRALNAVPDEIREIKGLKWLICSNGAKIYDNITEKQLYASYLSPEALRSVSSLIEDRNIMKEVFVDGVPYVEEIAMKDLGYFGIPEYFRDYVRETRMAIPMIAAFVWKHDTEIENINFIHKNEQDKLNLLYELTKFEGLYTLTTSLRFNLEIGGINADKGSALKFICSELGIPAEETMCIGDNNNDVTMLEFAGFSVAMEDASIAAKEAADFVTSSADSDGVALSINSYFD